MLILVQLYYVVHRSLLCLGVNNATFQVIWSPHVLLVDGRRNKNDLYDIKIPAFMRILTYELPLGDEMCHDVNQIAVTPARTAEAKAICEELVAHFGSTEHFTISRMVLYFKVLPLYFTIRLKVFFLGLPVVFKFATEKSWKLFLLWDSGDESKALQMVRLVRVCKQTEKIFD